MLRSLDSILCTISISHSSSLPFLPPSISLQNAHPSQNSLKWTFSGRIWTPAWTTEPDISAIKALAAYHLRYLLPELKLNITFLAQGTFNKTYDITQI